MLRIALLALAISLPVVASAQKDSAKPGAEAAPAAQALPDTLRPGDLDLSGIPAGETTYTVRLLAPMQQEIGSLTERVLRDGDTLVRTSTVSIPMAGQNERVTAELDAATHAFRSVMMEGVTAAGSLVLENGVVVGERQIARPQQSQQAPTLPDPVAVNDVVDGEVYGDGWNYAIVRALRLAEGETHHAMVYRGRDGIQTVRLTVLAAETLKPGGGAVMTLVPVEFDDGEQTMTYYVDPETRLVELVRFSPQAGVEVEFDRD